MVLLCVVVSCAFVFFQAEDGIRDYNVTGVQTCALPIYEGCFASSFTAVSFSLAGGPAGFAVGVDVSEGFASPRGGSCTRGGADAEAPATAALALCFTAPGSTMTVAAESAGGLGGPVRAQ